MIGVFDSGSGGLSVLAALARALPGRRFLYLGDHARAPYGNRSPEEVLAFTRDGVDRLFAQGCRLVILACNTACALALRPLQETWLPSRYPDRRLLGVFVPLVEALTERPWNRDEGRPDPGPRFRLAVFATPATVRSGAFGREVTRRLPGVEVAEIPCPGLVELIERGAPAAEIEAAVAGFLSPLSAAGVPPPERAVLGCTHYPLVAGAFARALPPGTAILRQPAIVAASLARYLERWPAFDRKDGEADGGDGAVALLTTGEPERIASGIARLAGVETLLAGRAGEARNWRRAAIDPPGPLMQRIAASKKTNQMGTPDDPPSQAGPAG